MPLPEHLNWACGRCVYWSPVGGGRGTCRQSPPPAFYDPYQQERITLSRSYYCGAFEVGPPPPKTFVERPVKEGDSGDGISQELLLEALHVASQQLFDEMASDGIDPPAFIRSGAALDALQTVASHCGVGRLFRPKV